MTDTAVHPSQVSIVVLNCNGYDDACACLRSLLRFTSPDAEILVCDNGSIRNEAALFQEEFGERIRYERFEKNLGVTNGFNAAIGLATRPLVVGLNNDTEVTEGWLEPLLDTMKDASVAACQPKLRSLFDRSFFDYSGACGGYLDCFGYPFTRGRVIDTIEKDSGQYDQPCDIHWTSGACMMFRRALGEKHGGFQLLDEVSLCWRWRNDGYKIRSVPASVVCHKGAVHKDYSPQRRFLYHRNNLLTILSLGSPLQLLIVLLPRLMLECATIVYYLCVGRPSAAFAVLRALGSFFLRAPAVFRGRPAALHRSTLMPVSIIWNYFILRRHTFQELLTA